MGLLIFAKWPPLGLFQTQTLGVVGQLPLQKAAAGPDRVIPLTVDLMAAEFDGFEFFAEDPHACGIDVGIEFAAYRQAGFCRRGGDELDDHLMTDERLTTPISGDE